MFKKGDKVEILKHGYFNINKGVGVIIDTISDVFIVEVGDCKERHRLIDKYNYCLSFSSEELKLVESKPDRYKTDSIDVIDFVKLYDLNFNLGNVVKYVCRNKGTDVEDYKKAIDYLQRELKHLKSLDN